MNTFSVYLVRKPLRIALLWLYVVSVHLLLQSVPMYPSLHSQVPTVMLQAPLTHGGVQSE